MADEQEQEQIVESMEVDASTAESIVSESGTGSGAEDAAMDDAKDGSASDSTVTDGAVESKKAAADSGSFKKCPICSANRMSAGTAVYCVYTG